MVIRARVRDATLSVEVADDGAGLPGPGAGLARDGHGLANVGQRIAAYYGERASLALHPGPGGRGAVARLTMPAAPDPASAAAGPGRAGAAPEGSAT